MTDAPLPHLDDERLSAALDGDDDAGVVAAHLDACAECRRRSTALAEAAALVAGASVAPLDPVLLDALIATAVAEADERPAAPVVALGARRRSRLVPPPAWLMGAAAALVLLAGLGSMLRAGDQSGDRADLKVVGDQSTQFEADAGSVSEAAPTAGGAEAGAGAGAARPSAAGNSGADEIVVDLGDYSDPDELVRAVERGPAIVGQASALRATDSAKERSSPPSTTTTTRPVNRARCVSAAQAIGAGRFGALQSSWAVRWNGADAEVLVFWLTEPAEGVTRQALVLRRPGCELLADPRF